MRILKSAAAIAVAALLVLGTGVATPSGEALARGYAGSSQAKTSHSHRHRVHKHRTAHRAGVRRGSERRHARSAQRRYARSAAYRSHRMGLGATAAAASYGVHAGRSGGVWWSASSSCLDSSLRAVVHQVAAQFGSVRVNSTCRSRGQNRRAGGAHRSHHLTGNAVDFRVFANTGAVAAFLRSNGSVGGFKHYGGGLFHIDTGARRSW